MTDYIKKEDAVNLFEALADSLDTFEFRMAAQASANELRKMPSACFAPVQHGWWKNRKDEHTCSVCDYSFCDEWYSDDDVYHYCPNCGARMDGEYNE